jgi:hypothetical protein
MWRGCLNQGAWLGWGGIAPRKGLGPHPNHR